jgi:hypothetical protein
LASLSFWLSHRNPTRIPLLPMLAIYFAHFIFLDLIIEIIHRRRVQVMKLVIMHDIFLRCFSEFSVYIGPLLIFTILTVDSGGLA